MDAIKSVFIIFFLAAFLFSIAMIFVIAFLYKNNKQIPERKGSDRRSTDRRLRERRLMPRECADRRCVDRRISDRRIKQGTLMDRINAANLLSPSMLSS